MHSKNVKRIIAAVRNESEFKAALNGSAHIIFCLESDVLTLLSYVKKAHEAQKKLFIHIDLTDGIGKDKSGILLAKKFGVDGIISTRVNIIKSAREVGVFTVQRFFVVDSKSLVTTLESIKSSKPDMIEIMPGIATKAIKTLSEKVDIPIIAGGLIETEDEMNDALNNGAKLVSTGKRELWK